MKAQQSSTPIAYSWEPCSYGQGRLIIISESGSISMEIRTETCDPAQAEELLCGLVQAILIMNNEGFCDQNLAGMIPSSLIRG